MDERELEGALRTWLRARGFKVYRGPRPIDLLAEKERRSWWIECKGDQKNDRALRLSFFTGLGQLVSRFDAPGAAEVGFAFAVSGQYARLVREHRETLSERISVWIVTRSQETPPSVGGEGELLVEVASRDDATI